MGLTEISSIPRFEFLSWVHSVGSSRLPEAITCRDGNGIFVPTPHGFFLPHPRPAPHDGENFLPHPRPLRPREARLTS